MSTGIKTTAAVAVLLIAQSAAALTPAERCAASKLKTAGKYGFCRLKAESKAVKTGGSPDYSKCDETFGFKWGQAETNAGSGVCPSEGDQSALQAFITQHTNAVAAALSGGPLPDCPSDLATCNTNLGTCTADLADALACGNGAVDAGEDCDQADLGGKTCVTQGFAGGALACASGCAFDTSACWNARFADNADGTITDNETSLMWEKKTELDGSTNFANLHEADNAYRWAGTCSLNGSTYCQPTTAAATLCAANAEGGTTQCDECTGGDGTCSATETVWTWAAALNTASFAGFTNWRVPTRAELQGIVDFADGTPPVVEGAFHGASCGEACTDITDPDCSCTQSDFYWSASKYPLFPESTWVVYFLDGTLFAFGPPADFIYVRAVRTGP